ncbi:MAG: ATP-dependent helicase [Jaaginema sp. PMC 1079.18]|nr:ATP-dependent helicase [Jaaginema sp. PMC 1080.18]MEC4851003.1 ATP-dependent helicase [Jaaginema sp. PMC 1079.18]MEC4867748.1 ATP-dependent helicase [Jaaginema sp. PMC 1078.18]
MTDLTLNDRDRQLQELQTSLRPGQQSLADWQGGRLAVSAVPGAGKSHSLAVAAAIAIARYQLHPKRQLLVVTFTRSAAAAIKSKIRDRLKDLRLPLGSFSVQTLHGLALNIASRHPDISGLNLETQTLVTPNQSHYLLKNAVEQWISRNSQLYQTLLAGNQFDGEESERLRRQSVLRTEVLPSLAHTVVREAKSSRLRPEDLYNFNTQAPDSYNILAVAAGLYENYEKLLRSRNFIDYDDMILAALRVLNNPSIRQLWQNQIFAVFEDEAQDSTPLQFSLLETLAASPDNPDFLNIARVGDPNQAINSTFTPADPVYFNRFCDLCATEGNLATMNQAGRSSPIILDAANYLLAWVNQQWQKDPDAPPFRPQNILPVAPDDPQTNANPTPEGLGLEIYQPPDINATVQSIGDRVTQLFQDNPDRSAAILVRENRQARFLQAKLTELLRETGITVYEVGENQRNSHIPLEIYKLLQFIDRPHSPDRLKTALEVLASSPRQLIAVQDLNSLATAPEKFLYPNPLDPPQKSAIAQARRYCTQLLNARMTLGPYQLISFLGMTLRYTGSELATVQKLSDRIAQQTTGRNSLKTILQALGEIVTAERFEGVEEDSEDIYTRPKQLTIITMHKAKGLDWDYVFLPFLHSDVLPGDPWIPTAAQFLGDFTLAEVARAQIRTALHQQDIQGDNSPVKLPLPLVAWDAANQLKKAEEYRLLYVAMTRAKRLLWLSAAQQGPFRWSTLSWQKADNFQKKNASPAIMALRKRFAKHCLRF